MEKFSSFERVVGDIPEEDKDRILREKAEKFSNQNFDNLKGKEKEKTETELKIIALANDASNEVRRKYGMEQFDVPAKNIHIIKEEAWPEDKWDSGGFYETKKQAIAMREQSSRSVLMTRTLHELLHFKSYTALQVSDEEPPMLRDYRMGLVVARRGSEGKYFTNLNEAVTEELTKRLVRTLLKNPLFADEVRRTKDIMSKYPSAKNSRGESFFGSDVYYAAVEEGTRTWRQVLGRIFGKTKKVKIFADSFAYSGERKVLNLLVEKIFERNSDLFKDKEEIFDLFVRGMITGNILPLGKVIEKTFGKGTLRRIGELDGDVSAQGEFVKSL